jgi:hypothetical protein
MGFNSAHRANAHRTTTSCERWKVLTMTSARSAMSCSTSALRSEYWLSGASAAFAASALRHATTLRASNSCACATWARV